MAVEFLHDGYLFWVCGESSKLVGSQFGRLMLTLDVTTQCLKELPASLRAVIRWSSEITTISINMNSKSIKTSPKFRFKSKPGSFNQLAMRRNVSLPDFSLFQGFGLRRRSDNVP